MSEENSLLQHLLDKAADEGNPELAEEAKRVLTWIHVRTQILIDEKGYPANDLMLVQELDDGKPTFKFVVHGIVLEDDSTYEELMEKHGVSDKKAD